MNGIMLNPRHPIALDSLPSSVQAVQPWEHVSSKYQFLSTRKVAEVLDSIGLQPYYAKQAGTRIEGKEHFTKHLIRFRSQHMPILQGNTYPEVILQNAHDRASAFVLEMGLFRLVCSNGLTVSFGSWGKYRIRHVASSLDDVIVAAEAIVDLFPMIEGQVLKMQNTALTLAEAQDFAQEAQGLRWEPVKAPYHFARLLHARRQEDQGFDLWSVLNVIQENLIKGQRVLSRMSRERSSRRVQSIDMGQHINRGLWELAIRRIGQ